MIHTVVFITSYPDQEDHGLNDLVVESTPMEAVRDTTNCLMPGLTGNGIKLVQELWYIKN